MGMQTVRRAARRYEAGREWEYTVTKHLADTTAGRTMRAASSAGPTKADLAVFVPDGRILLIQCKKYDPKIPPEEWAALWETASWYGHLMYAPSAGAAFLGPAVVPLVATMGKRGQGPAYYRLAAPRVLRSREWPWCLYDVVHGSDLPAGKSEVLAA